jgi:hypothetical protein
VKEAPDTDKISSKLAKWFSWWETVVAAERDFLEKLLFTLDHRYTDANLSFDSLKGQDQATFLHLRDACAKTNIYLCFGNTERVVVSRYEPSEHSSPTITSDVRSPYHSLKEISSKLRSKTIVSMSGAVIGHDVEFNEDNFINSLLPDEERGSESSLATHVHRQTVHNIVLYIVGFLLS